MKIYTKVVGAEFIRDLRKLVIAIEESQGLPNKFGLYDARDCVCLEQLTECLISEEAVGKALEKGVIHRFGLFQACEKLRLYRQKKLILFESVFIIVQNC